MLGAGGPNAIAATGSRIEDGPLRAACLFGDGELVDDPEPGAIGLFAGDFGGDGTVWGKRGGEDQVSEKLETRNWKEKSKSPTLHRRKGKTIN